MDIRIRQLLDGAREARGLTVIIDVFRAFTVEVFLAQGGAESITAVGDRELAYRMKERDPSVLLVGERRGIKLPGFDLGNSPWEVTRTNVSGRRIVHTTSAGTQGIVNASGADEILAGSLVNAGAIARYILKRAPKEVSLVAMGLDACRESEEDTLCARYIKSLLEGEPLATVREEALHLRETTGRKFFDPSLPQFPEGDFALCTDVDRSDIVLRAVKTGESAYSMERVV